MRAEREVTIPDGKRDPLIPPVSHRICTRRIDIMACNARVILLERFERSSERDCEWFVVCDELTGDVKVGELPELRSLRETNEYRKQPMLTEIAGHHGSATPASGEVL